MGVWPEYLAQLSINGMIGCDMERLKLDSYLATFLKTSTRIENVKGKSQLLHLSFFSEEVSHCVDLNVLEPAIWITLASNSTEICFLLPPQGWCQRCAPSRWINFYTFRQDFYDARVKKMSYVMS